MLIGTSLTHSRSLTKWTLSRIH